MINISQDKINIIREILKDVPENEYKNITKFLNKTYEKRFSEDDIKKELYSELKNKREQNYILNLDNLSKEQLTQLWYEECISDNEIASLFNTTNYQVKKKRKEFSINTQQCSINNLVKYLQEYIVTMQNINKLDNTYSEV